MGQILLFFVANVAKVKGWFVGVVYTADMTTPLTESGVAAGSPLERE